MTVKVTLGVAGRIVLPKPLRDELHLAPGDALELESSGEEITLRPARGLARLKKKKGIWSTTRVSPWLPTRLIKLCARSVKNAKRT